MTSQSDKVSKDEGEKKSFRRRQYLVDRKRQLAATVRVAGLVLVLLITLNAVLAYQAFNITNSVMARDPVMGERMRAIDNRNLAITAGISLIILAMIVRKNTKFDPGKESIQTLGKIVTYVMAHPEFARA